MVQRILSASRSASDVVRFTVSPSGSRVVTLCDFVAPCAATVDWGDGAHDSITADAPLSHTYADTSPRQICIRGKLGGFWSTSARPQGVEMVTSLDEVASLSLTSLAETFRQCTRLSSLPPVIAAPALSHCHRAFYQCKSITSPLPALWLTHAGAAHEACFADCFLSFWGKFNSSCARRKYVAAVDGQSYFQKYGTGCPAARYVAAVPQRTFGAAYGNSCPHLGARQTHFTRWLPHSSTCKASFVNGTHPWNPCSHSSAAIDQGTKVPTWSAGAGMSDCTCGNAQVKSGTIEYTGSLSYGKPYCQGTGSGCQIVYSYGSSAYSQCTQSAQSGTSSCNSNCKRIYTSGQSAYYQCTQSGVTCQTEACPHPWANAADVTAALNAGWA